MTRDEVLEVIHEYATWTSWVAEDGRGDHPPLLDEVADDCPTCGRDLSTTCLCAEPGDAA